MNENYFIVKWIENVKNDTYIFSVKAFDNWEDAKIFSENVHGVICRNW